MSFVWACKAIKHELSHIMPTPAWCLWLWLIHPKVRMNNQHQMPFIPCIYSSTRVGKELPLSQAATVKVATIWTTPTDK